MDGFLKCIGAVNDESRVKILKFLIIHGKSCVCELESSLEMMQSRLSRHLKILKEGGFLDVERVGSYAYYYLSPATDFHSKIISEIAELPLAIQNKQTACA